MDRTIEISDFPQISVLKQKNDFSSNLQLIHQEKGIFTYKLSVEAQEAATPSSIELRWRLPAINIKGVWKCGALHNKRLQYDWELEHLRSRISVDAPAIAVFGHDDRNITTFACSEAVNLVEMNALLREEDNHLYCHLTFFKERHPKIQNYEARIRVDLRPILYSQALQELSQWWENFDHLKPCPVPDLARAPMYSTWYNFHQDLDEELLLEECKLAASMGFKLVLMDDGWQTMDNNRGYDYTGDWQPERFPDLKGLVAKVHDIGLQFGLWFSVPFCGKKSKAYQKFKGKFLTENHRWTNVFDPRYPEVRQHLIDIYTNALINYNLDAFKLDFIDDFRVYPETELTQENGRDYANVNEAVERLLHDATQALRAIKPDIAIEFRQKYIGPAMRKFGNMFRAFDCPNDPVSNRIRITDVKLLCGASAVHSDMLTWHPEEKVELAAIQVLNGIFAVPQVSILFSTYPAEHKKMIQFYTQYWTENADLLMDGHFTPVAPLNNYPLLKAEKDGQLILGIYDDIIASIEHHNRIDILNGKMSNSIIVKNKGDHKVYQLSIWDCMGKLEQKEIIIFDTNILELEVKAAGLIRLEKLT